jgi:hypothetical protein
VGGGAGLKLLEKLLAQGRCVFILECAKRKKSFNVFMNLIHLLNKISAIFVSKKNFFRVSV